MPPYLKPESLQLPQYIIDLVGSLYDEGQDDESICSAAVKAWMEMNKPTLLLNNGLLAQLVEHRPFKAGVVGSIPTGSTKPVLPGLLKQ